MVREGEYNTIQRYAQSFLSKAELDAVRTVKNSNFLSAAAKQNLLNTARAKMGILDSQYQNLASEYQRQIDNAYSGQPRQITNYSGSNFAAPEQNMSVMPQEDTQQSGFWGAINNFLYGNY